MDILRYAKLAPLFGKKLSDLSLGDLQVAADTFDVNVPVTEELKTAALALLQGQNIDSVAELVQSPESVQQLISFFKRGANPSIPSERLVRCSHCGEFFLIQS